MAMKLELRFKGLPPSDPLRDYTKRRVHSHLSRFGDDVSRVIVRISDINGPKGGVDKRCQVVVKGARVGLVALDELSADAYSAVAIAMERIGRSVGRRLERTRERADRGRDPSLSHQGTAAGGRWTGGTPKMKHAGTWIVSVRPSARPQQLLRVFAKS
jgi:hypothetical protein